MIRVVKCVGVLCLALADFGCGDSGEGGEVDAGLGQNAPDAGSRDAGVPSHNLDGAAGGSNQADSLVPLADVKSIELIEGSDDDWVLYALLESGRVVYTTGCDPIRNDLARLNVAWGSGVRQLAGTGGTCSSMYHVCAILEPDGAVECRKSLGRAERIAGISNAVKLSVLPRAGCALLDDGSVRCWGWGPGTAGTWARVSKTPDAPSGSVVTLDLPVVQDFETSDARTSFVTPDGKVFRMNFLGRPPEEEVLPPALQLWQANCAQLADGTTTCIDNYEKPTSTTTALTEYHRDSAYAVTSTGTLLLKLAAVTTPLALIADARSARGYTDRGCVRHDSGTVSCWGKGASLELDAAGKYQYTDTEEPALVRVRQQF